MRHKGPRNRIARQLGIDLGLKTFGTKSYARLLKKINIPPGQHGSKKRKKISERGIQLREKQKLKYMFSITEKQLKNYFKKASFKKGNTAFYLSQLLESRLDNIVYRLGFAPTRPSARQLVIHGHIAVNNKKITIPSYQVKVNDKISFLNLNIEKIPYIEKSVSNKDIKIPSWLQRDNLVGRLMSIPNNEEISKQINLRLIIEYYSK